ncbi:hypothetical protein AVEN_199363-1 [Araneus ventricosus]|uniref:DUF4817 domain-containing protein n=1 Tax=Araneus ventricosus TaxID=182803 RepID=A0A4Y2M1Y8_ARAVE|nr:hypothetical protein AVEN_199363-1 [Araneus ventricosus]
MWTPQEEAHCVAWVIKTKSNTQVQRNFRTQHGREPLSRPNIWALYTSFMETDTIIHKQGTGRRCAWVSDFVSMNQVHTELSPVASTFIVKSASSGA